MNAIELMLDSGHHIEVAGTYTYAARFTRHGQPVGEPVTSSSLARLFEELEYEAARLARRLLADFVAGSAG